MGTRPWRRLRFPDGLVKQAVSLVSLHSGLEAESDRVELPSELPDIRCDTPWVLSLDRHAGHQVRDVLHLGLSHPEAGELLRPDPHAARVDGRGVPREEVLVRDDVRLLEFEGDLRPASMGRDIDCERVALRETELLGEDLEPLLDEGLAESLRILHDLCGVVAPELEVLREGNSEGR